VPGLDLNADVGEQAMSAAREAELLGLVTSASVGCGAHAGTRAGVAASIEAAADAGVVIGVHPSYPDRAGFGRRPLDIDLGVLAESLLEQILTVQELARRAGSPVRFVKPHGALYHRTGHDPKVARMLADVVGRATADGRQAGDLAPGGGGLVLLLGAGADMLGLLEALGVTVVTEAFADRAYLPDGTLVPRDQPGAVLTDERRVVDQALSLAVDGRVRAVDGAWVELSASSLCLHGDTPGSLALARRVRRALEEASVSLAPFVS
jgi:5-oxoprolinase (ATP-hydrolysing) subunit A